MDRYLEKFQSKMRYTTKQKISDNRVIIRDFIR